MGERNNNNNSCTNSANQVSGISGIRETVCIDTYRVLDSCRDKDCFENVRVFLTSFGQEIIERTSNIRTKLAKVIWSYIDIETVPFNRGFYQLNIRIYVKLIFEACVCPGNVQEFEGIAVIEKKVILFGSEGNVSIFKSEPGCSGFCPNTSNFHSGNNSSNLPIAVIETVDPIVLNAKILDPRCACECLCCCGLDEIPDNVCCFLNGDLFDDEDCNKLVVSLGFFSVIRIERPAQYLINAIEYSVPDKECAPIQDDDPFSLFKTMAFPTSEFSPPSQPTCNC